MGVEVVAGAGAGLAAAGWPGLLVTTSRALAVTSFTPELTVPFSLALQLESLTWAKVSRPSSANLVSSLPQPSSSRLSFRTRMLFISLCSPIFLAAPPPRRQLPFMAMISLASLLICSSAASILVCASRMFSLSLWWPGVTLSSLASSSGYLVTLCTGTCVIYKYLNI